MSFYFNNLLTIQFVFFFFLLVQVSLLLEGEREKPFVIRTIIRLVKVLQSHKHGNPSSRTWTHSSINDLRYNNLYEILFVKSRFSFLFINIFKIERLRKRKILCTTIMLSIDGQCWKRRSLFPVHISAHGRMRLPRNSASLFF